MTPEELRQVLHDNTPLWRNKDSFTIMAGGLILLTLGAIYYLALFVWKHTHKYKPPRKPVAFSHEDYYNYRKEMGK